MCPVSHKRNRRFRTVLLRETITTNPSMNISQQTVTFAIMLALLAGGVGTVYAASPSKTDRMGGYARAHHFVHPRVSAVRQAVERKDYETWQKLTYGMPIRDIIKTEEQFMKLAQAHEHMEEGDFDEAYRLMQELGIDEPFKGHMRGGMRLYLELDDEQTEALAQAREAYQSGDQVRAQELLHELREELPVHVRANKSHGWMRTMHHVGE